MMPISKKNVVVMVCSTPPLTNTVKSLIEAWTQCKVDILELDYISKIFIKIAITFYYTKY